ncbi:MAG TPA: SDR family oxidoreductase [Candidatus Binatia bacterium]
MPPRTIVVTGATSGIGLSTAHALARTGARIVMVARDPARAAAAADDIRAASGNDAIEFVLADFAVLASVRDGAAALLERCPRIDVLVNNAAVVNTSWRQTIDGHEETFAVNQLAPFLLTTLLLERIVASGSEGEPARIVNVASDAHRLGMLEMDDLDSRRSYSTLRVYGKSKRANIVFTYELARRLADKPVTANCLHPGAVRTSLGRNNAPRWVGALVYGLARPFLRNPDGGARTSVFLASDPSVASVTGAYFKNCRPARSEGQTYDPALGAALWQECERRTGPA